MFRPFLVGLFSLAIVLSSLRAEDAERAPFAIATLNLPKVFKGCEPFTQKMAEFKQKLEQSEAGFHLRAEELKKETAKIMAEKAKMSPAELNAAEKSLAEKTSALQIDMNIKKRELLMEEARIYSTTYESLCAELKKICQARKIRLVVRSNIGDKDESQERDDILQRVNRAVLFDEELDLTKDVIHALNAASAANDEAAKEARKAREEGFGVDAFRELEKQGPKQEK